jgi:hypothetical protein
MNEMNGMNGMNGMSGMNGMNGIFTVGEVLPGWLYLISE